MWKPGNRIRFGRTHAHTVIAGVWNRISPARVPRPASRMPPPPGCGLVKPNVGQMKQKVVLRIRRASVRPAGCVLVSLGGSW